MLVISDACVWNVSWLHCLEKLWWSTRRKVQDSNCVFSFFCLCLWCHRQCCCLTMIRPHLGCWKVSKGGLVGWEGLKKLRCISKVSWGLGTLPALQQAPALLATAGRLGMPLRPAHVQPPCLLLSSCLFSQSLILMCVTCTFPSPRPKFWKPCAQPPAKSCCVSVPSLSALTGSDLFLHCFLVSSSRPFLYPENTLVWILCHLTVFSTSLPCWGLYSKACSPTGLVMSTIFCPALFLS